MISVLITTVGRNSLLTMLNSLAPQMSPDDYIYVAIDGEEFFEKTNTALLSFKDYVCQLHIIYEKENLGFWGHGLRNKYQRELKGDFILHADDDDVYTSGGIDTVKKYVADSDRNTIFFFKFWHDIFKRHHWWAKEVLHGNIGTPCGAIPNVPEKMGTWGEKYGGDFSFYKSCQFSCVFVDKVIYCVRPQEGFEQRVKLS